MEDIPIEYEFVQCRNTTSTCLLFTDSNTTAAPAYACTQHNTIRVYNISRDMRHEIEKSFIYISTTAEDMCIEENHTTWCQIQQIYLYSHCKSVSFKEEYSFWPWYICAILLLITTTTVPIAYQYLFDPESVQYERHQINAAAFK